MWRTAARVSSANASVSDGIGNRGIVSLLHIDQKIEDPANSHGVNWRDLALVMLAYSFLAGQRRTPADSAGFAPLGRPAVLPSGPLPGPRVALPGGHSMAHGHPPDRQVPPQAELTQ